MQRLDACYFCGTATDGPLREVSISPRAKRGDPEATVRVTLCPSCEHKLERVLGGLFDHVESRQVDRQDAASIDEDAPTTDQDEPAAASDAGRVDRIDVPSGRSDEQRGRRRLFSDPPAVPETPAAESDDTGANVNEEKDEAEEEDEDEDDAEIIGDEPQVRARASPGREDALAGVSVDEYNRVMRLLQNREFPMARRTFVDLASDAYDIGEETVERVLDAAIQGGALAERDGELVRRGDGGP